MLLMMGKSLWHHHGKGSGTTCTNCGVGIFAWAWTTRSSTTMMRRIVKRNRRSIIRPTTETYVSHKQRWQASFRGSLFATRTAVCGGVIDHPQHPESFNHSITGTLRQAEEAEGNWRDSPALNPTLIFPTVVVPNEVIHTLVRAPSLQPFLASRLELLEHVQRRLKVVRDYKEDANGSSSSITNSSSSSKLLLLHPNVVQDPITAQQWQQALENIMIISSQKQQNIDNPVRPGPDVAVRLYPRDFTVSYVLNQLLPTLSSLPNSSNIDNDVPDQHPDQQQPHSNNNNIIPTSFESIGHVAHLNLPTHIMPHRYLIGQVLLECLEKSSIRTVICKTDQVKGPYRTYEFEIVASSSAAATTTSANSDKNESISPTLVHHVEHGVQLVFDLQEVYWSSRLSQERKRLVDTVFQPGQVIADAFCGVGALCLQAAKTKGCVIYANDWNPHAISSLKDSAKRNHVKLKHVQCGDAYEFLMDLGLQNDQHHGGANDSGGGGGDGSERCGLPDHVILNYPLEAPRFLGSLRWWPTVSTSSSSSSKPAATSSKKHDKPSEGMSYSGPRVHVYTFARPEGDLTAEEVAIEAIASNLVVVAPPPPPEAKRRNNSKTGATTTATKTGTNKPSRAAELDEYGCCLHVHHVRDVAPSKGVFCVSFTATPKLLRYMKGDFS